MDSLEKLIAKRKKIVRAGAVLMIVYGLCAFIFFLLNALDVINVFDLADQETDRLVELSTMGTCALGVLTGILCLAKINAPDWYGILYILTICTVVLNAFVGVSHGSTFGNFAGLIIVYIELIFTCICSTMLYKLRASQTKISE